MIVDLIFLFGLGSISCCIKNKLSGSVTGNNALMLLMNSFLNMTFVYLSLRIFGMYLIISNSSAGYRIEIGLLALFFGLVFSTILGFVEAYIHKVIEIKIGVKSE